MSKFINPRLGRLETYVPGEQPKDQQYIKLNTNELPYPPSPEVIARVNAAQVADLRLYSDPTCGGLVEKLARQYDVAPENVFVGNGSDEVLNFAFACYCRAGAAFADLTYGFYGVFAELYGIDADIKPLRDDFSIDPADYMNVGKAVVIANPNAPTGLVLPVETIEAIVRSNPDHVVIIDEAYVDFGATSVVPLTKKYENLLVASTFSKSRALAGARVGFGIGNEALIRDLNRIKFTTNPYNINRLSLVAAEAALDSQAYFDEKDRLVAQTRASATAALRALGFETTDSMANFIFAKSDRIGGGDLYRQLKARGILVRHFDTARIKDFVRITVGTPAEMDALLGAINDILNSLD
ncbi:MAG: histidinol-phosphate transaminase [Clostridia bacterium]|nr:histidinol-phosphate transaminase [Clostridia bacterium]